MKEVALQLEHVKKSYQDGQKSYTVLDDVNLSVKNGEFVAIVGPSGSGKSTLLSIAGALLCADEGAIIIEQDDIAKKKQKEWTSIRRNKIGFIFQNHQLIPYLTVKEQLKLVLNLKGKDKNKSKEQEIEDLLEDLGLFSCKNKYPAQMSGGEKQRTAIARAFINEPSIILADEPTASLDASRGRQVVELMKQLVKKRNKAVVMVTHDERILDLVDSIYRLEEGKLVLVS